MKTTIELPNALVRAAKEIAAREGTTLRALAEAGLRLVLEERAQRPPFSLRDASFAGRGLRDEFRDVGWDAVRRAAYDERGG